jgi:hypothetical protein
VGRPKRVGLDSYISDAIIMIAFIGGKLMPGILVREVEIEILEKLKQRAKRNGRSLQNEVHSIIVEFVESNPLSDEETASVIKSSLRGREFSDSAVLLREDRSR